MLSLLWDLLVETPLGRLYEVLELWAEARTFEGRGFARLVAELELGRD